MMGHSILTSRYIMTLRIEKRVYRLKHIPGYWKWEIKY
jgi:hypothetical protein